MWAEVCGLRCVAYVHARRVCAALYAACAMLHPHCAHPPLIVPSQVVEALRICYTDFKPLRVAGDLIFKVIGVG